MKLYSIKHWAKNYEKAQTRKVENAQWVPVPVKHDGKAFRRLMALADGPEIYGAWMLLLQVAAKCPTRGELRDEDGPLTAEDLMLKTGCRQDLFERAFEVLTSERIGWMLVADWASPDKLVSLQDRTVQDKTEQERTEQDTAPPVVGAGSQKGLDRSNDILEVFEHYRTYHPAAHKKPTSKLKEWALVRSRLEEGYTVAELKGAIDGNHLSPYHCGRNESQTRYQNLELIVRDGSKVNAFLETARHPPSPVMSEATQLTLAAADSYLTKRAQEDGFEDP